MAEQESHFYAFGRFRLKTAERVLLREGELVPLTPKVFDILLTLVEKGGQVVEKDDLMKRVWPSTFVEEGNLTQNVSLLRKALGESATGPQFIETVPRRGYRFVAPVTRINGNGEDNFVESVVDGHSVPGTQLNSSGTTVSAPLQQSASSVNRGRGTLDIGHWTFFSRRLPAVALTLAAVLATVVGIAYLSGKNNAGASTSAIQSIAVLPFVDDSPDADAEYLDDEIAESLVNSLTKLPKLRVVPRSVMINYKGRNVDPRM